MVGKMWDHVKKYRSNCRKCLRWTNFSLSGLQYCISKEGWHLLLNKSLGIWGQCLGEAEFEKLRELDEDVMLYSLSLLSVISSRRIVIWKTFSMLEFQAHRGDWQS